MMLVIANDVDYMVRKSAGCKLYVPRRLHAKYYQDVEVVRMDSRHLIARCR